MYASPVYIYCDGVSSQYASIFLFLRRLILQKVDICPARFSKFWSLGDCIYLIFSSLCVRSFVRLLVRGINNGHLIGRRNDVTANMAAQAVCRCLAASRHLDTRASQFGSPRRGAHLRRSSMLLSGARELLWLSVRGYFCFVIWVLWLSALRAAKHAIGQRACLALALPYWLRYNMTKQFF